jgi:hypothetical protein
VRETQHQDIKQEISLSDNQRFSTVDAQVIPGAPWDTPPTLDYTIMSCIYIWEALGEQTLIVANSLANG